MIKVVYDRLLALYSKQGWWPFLEQDEFGAWKGVYHTGDYSFPDDRIISMPEVSIKEDIYPARYYNQKYKYLLSLSIFFKSLVANAYPTREQLLTLKGVGNETADSILLYGFHQPQFVVDAYTRRIFSLWEKMLIFIKSIMR